MYYLGTYKNGYCGCDEEIGIIADNMQDAEEIFMVTFIQLGITI